MAWETLIFNGQSVLRSQYFHYACLRDNVRHHFEHDVPNHCCPALHAIADTPWGVAPARIDPHVLRAELETAWPRIQAVPIEGLALSIRTRAALENASEPPDIRGTVLQRVAQWPIPLELARYGTLADLLGPHVTDLLRLARETPRGECLVVRSISKIDAGKTPTAKRLFFVPTAG